MHLLSCLLVLGAGAGASARVLPRAQEPCPHTFAENSPLVNSYIVALQEDHTLDDHFQHIGVNLTETGIFHYMESLHGYRAELDDRLVHELIRYDPGVKRVHQGSHINHVNSIIDVEEGIEQTQSQSLNKRWAWSDGTWEQVDRETEEFWQSMITAGKKISKTEGATKWNVSMMDKAGQGVDIYIVDSGVRVSHSNFEGRASNFNNLQQTPYTNPSVTINDEAGHGTHVAGIAAADYFGVAQWANIVNVKISCQDPTKCNGTDTGAMQAMDDIITAHNKKKSQSPEGWKGSVVNFSFGLPSSAELLGTLSRVNEAGIPIAAAAGNVVSGTKGANRIALGPPCSGDFSICVGASTSRYTASDISAWGQAVNVWAPGENILSCGSANDFTVKTKTGTSMASPQVAGIMAIIVGYEGINSDAATVLSRVRANWLPDAMGGFPDIPKNTKAFANTGINDPDKYSWNPYDGPGARSKVKARELGSDGINKVQVREQLAEPPSKAIEARAQVTQSPRDIPSDAAWKNVETVFNTSASAPNTVFQEYHTTYNVPSSADFEGVLTGAVLNGTAGVASSTGGATTLATTTAVAASSGSSVQSVAATSATSA